MGNSVSLYGAMSLVPELGAVLGREGEEREERWMCAWTPFPATAGVFGRPFTLCTVSPFAL